MRLPPAEAPELSVVVPFYRESTHVGVVIETIRQHVEPVCERYEIIAVDDGSPDDTWECLSREAQRHPRVTALRLSRNFGKEHAVSAGLDAAAGRAVVVMDGDLQHPPSLIPQMLEAWRRGEADVVEACKRSRGRQGVFSRVFAHGFYRLLKLLSGFDLQGACDFKLLDRKVVEAWRRMPERSLFFRGMIAWLGFRRASVPFDVPERVGGSSKWSFFALVRLAMSAITAFSSGLLQLVTLFGVLFLCFAVVAAVHTLVMKLSGHAITGFATVILLLLMIGSLLMISLGLVGLYLARIYDEVKGRPRYVVAESSGPAAGARVERDRRAETVTPPGHVQDRAEEFEPSHGRRAPFRHVNDR